MQRAGVNNIWEENTMRRIPRTVKAMLAIVALLATTSLGVAAALAGYLPIGGYVRGGYEYSALVGHDLSGEYDRGGYEFSAPFGNDLFGGSDRGDYEFSTASFGYIPIGGYEREGYQYS
jgi:hypothetical protein